MVLNFDLRRTAHGIRNTTLKTVEGSCARASLFVCTGVKGRIQFAPGARRSDSNAGGKPRNLAAFSGTARIRIGILERAAPIC